MKKISALVVILIALITFSYFAIEKVEVEKRRALDQMQSIYDGTKLGELRGMEMPNSRIVKSGNDFFAVKEFRLVDNAQLDFVFSILSNIRVKKYLTDDEVKLIGIDKFFTTRENRFTFEFDKGSITYILGDKLLFDKSFYMEIKNSTAKKSQFVIAFDDSDDEGAYPEKLLHRNPEKYNRLLAILQLPDKYFYDLRVFKQRTVNDVKASISGIEISSFRNPTFRIDLVKQRTLPPVLMGLTYKKGKFESFLNALTQVKAKELVARPSKKELSEHEATYAILKHNGKVETIDVYRRYKNHNDYYYLASSFTDDLFILDEVEMKNILVHYQDFWLKNFFIDDLSIDRNVPQNMTVTVDGQTEKVIADLKSGMRFSFDEESRYVPVQASFKNLMMTVLTEADYAVVVDNLKLVNDLKRNMILKFTLRDTAFYFSKINRDLYLVYPQKNVAVVYKNRDLLSHAINYFLIKE